MRTDMRVTVEAMLDEYAGLTARLDRMQSDVAAVTASAHSADGAVAATVKPSGELLRLSIDQTAMRRLDAHTLALQIVEAVGLAAAEARRQVGVIVSEALPSRFDGAVRADGTVDVARLLPPNPAG